MNLSKYAVLIAMTWLCWDGLLAQEYNSLHWRIDGVNLEKPSYLYGTMHSRDGRIHDLGDSVMLALSRCDAVALEIATDKMGIKDMFGALKQMYMRDTTLSDLYPPETYQLVKKTVSKKMGLLGVFYNVDKIKPMFLASLLDEIDTEAETVNQQKLLLDMYFQEAGIQQKKRIISIESVDEQMSAIDQMPLSVQAEMLLDQVNNMGKEDTSTQVMIQRYVEQDLDALLAMYEGEKESKTESFDQAIVVKRNRTMAERMDSFMRIQPTFTAVGALHLPGKKGIINLLRQKGYSVTPVYSSDKVYRPIPKPKIDTLAAAQRPMYERPFILLNAAEAGFQTLIPDTAIVEWLEDDMIIYTYNDRRNDLFYSIAYTALPDSSAVNNETFYNEIALRLAKTKGAELVYQKMVPVLDYEAQEGQLQMGDFIPNAFLRYVMVRTGNDFYLLSVTGDKDKIMKPDVNVFFDSFMVIP